MIKIIRLGLVFIFLVFVYINKQNLFAKFNSEVVDRYLRSQDILDTEDKIKDRIFVSDEEIYIASGYLYVNGAKPTDYNFQHPPFIKYLFGLSSKLFGLPLLPNIVFAALLIIEIFLLGKLIFRSEWVGFLASALVMFDPVFKEITIYALLDLGQMVFILGFILTTFFWKKHFIGQGVLLGLACASKFYSPVVIFVGIIYLYKIFTKQFKLKHELCVLVFSFLTFSTVYFKAFPFNIFFEQARIVKFMMDHNQAVEWGSVLTIFFGGYLAWPILFLVNLYLLFKIKLQDIRFLFVLIPLVYLLIMCFQIPFTRYFILILPFLYLNLSGLVINLQKK